MTASTRCGTWHENKTHPIRYCYCYARSKDGVTWEKPNLGLIEYKGSKQNNIVLTGVVETTVFIDPVAPAEARFKTISAMHWPDPKRAGLYVHTSPDGIHWKMSDTRVLPLLPDTANQAFYDSRLKKYVANIRVWAPMRKVGRVEMDDITKPWPFDKTVKPYHIWGEDKIPVPSHEVPIVFGYDEHDPVPSDHYNAACVQYPWADQAYFLFPSAYRHFPEPPIGKYGNDGLVDIQMATSRDGVKWTRLSREPYVALGTQDEVDRGQLYMAVGMLRRGGKIFQYYGGYQVSHGTPENLRIEDRLHLPAGAAARRVCLRRRGRSRAASSPRCRWCSRAGDWCSTSTPAPWAPARSKSSTGKGTLCPAMRWPTAMRSGATTWRRR